MRKLIVSMNLTLDGFLSGPDCGLDWHFQYWSGDMADALCRQLAKADTILLGRKTYMAMAGYWQAKATAFSCPRDELAYADMMNRYTKIVVSNTRTTATWSNSVILRGNPEEGIRQLKQQSGKDIILYGSAGLLAALVPTDLIDGYRLWIHPVTIGTGKALFSSLRHMRPLKLMSTEIFRTGVVLLSYDLVPGTAEKESGYL